MLERQLFPLVPSMVEESLVTAHEMSGRDTAGGS